MVRKKSLFGDANKTKTSQECEWNRSCQRFCTCSQPGYQQFRRKGLNDLGEKAGECLFLLQQAKDKRGRLGWVMAHHCALYVRGLPGQPSGAWWSQLLAATLSGLPSAPLPAHQEGRLQR